MKFLSISKQCSYLFLSCVVFNVCYASKSLPKGFEDYFEQKPTLVTLRNLDGSFTTSIELISDFESVRLGDNDESHNKVAKYLVDNNIRPQYWPLFIAQLEKGVVISSNCEGYIADCRPEINDFGFNYDFNEKKLYVFVDEHILDLTDTLTIGEYYSSLNREPGLINRSDLYFSLHRDGVSSASINDNLTWGFTHGNLFLDTNLNTNSDSRVYDLSYNFENKDKLFKFGYYRYLPNYNTTGFLTESISSMPQVSFSIGRSDNLLVDGVNGNKSLVYYSPQVGTIEVYRDDRLIYQSSTAEGQNSINYKQLPAGRYEVTLVVYVSGQEVSRTQQYVFNSSDDSLKSGQYDYSVSLGMLAPFGDSKQHKYLGDEYFDNRYFGHGAVTYQLQPALLLGGHSFVTDQEYAVGFGTKYSNLALNSRVELAKTYFENAEHLNATLVTPFLSMTYEKFDNQTGGYLTDYLYDPDGYEKFYISTYKNISNVSLYGSVSYENRKINDPIFAYESEFTDITLGTRFNSFWQSSVDISVQSDFEFDNTQFYLNWSLPLSDSVDIVTNVTANKEGVEQFYNMARMHNILDSDYISDSYSISNTYDRITNELYQSTDMSLNATTDDMQLSVNAYATNRDNNIGINGNLSSTQIFNSGSVNFTSLRSNSFFLLDVKDRKHSPTEVDSKELGFLNISRDGRRVYKELVKDSNKVISLNSYSSYDINYDTESVDLFNSGDTSAELFALPGTVYTLQPNVHRKVSFIGSFEDINNQVVSSMSCKGEGCVSVNELVAGVYRVTVLEGMDFALTSDSGRCFIPVDRKSNQMNFGNNYCLPTDTDQLYSVIIDNRGYLALFVGLFDTEENDIIEAVNRFKSLGYRVIQKEVGSLSAIYIVQNKAKMDHLLANYSKQVAEIRKLARNSDKVNNIEYPIVNVKN